MSTMESLSRAECTLATVRGLVDVAHFFFDHADGDDWVRLKTPFGFLLNSISAELGRADRAVDVICREHFAANANGRKA